MTEGAEQDDWRARFNYIEGSVGTFGKIDQSNFIYEAFAGVGKAFINNDRSNETANIRYLKPFIQPSIGIRKKSVEIALTTRIALVTYQVYDIRIADQRESTNLLSFFDEKQSTLVFEPVFTSRFGTEVIKFEFQYAYSTFAQREVTNGWVDKSVFTLGLNFYLK